MRELNVSPPDGYPPFVGRSVWALEDTRSRTLELLATVPEAAVDWIDPGAENSIGSLLYHVSLIELDWVYADILGRDYPDEARALLPVDDRDAQGVLSKVHGKSLAAHIERLAAIRRLSLRGLADLTDEGLRAPRAMGNYSVTPEWALHHVMQHEAEHRGQIGEVLVRYRAEAGSDDPI